MRHTFRLLIPALLLAGASLARGDSPLPPPEKMERWSPDHKIFAVTDPDAQTTTVFRVNVDGTQTKLWAMVGWYRDLHVANDGTHVVIAYEGGNLIPQDYRKDKPMLFFVDQGRLLAVITLQDLVTDFSKLGRSVSHFSWGNVSGFNAAGQLGVTTVEGPKNYNVAGKPVEK